MPFLQTSGTQFVLNGNPFHLFGCTIYNDLQVDNATIQSKLNACVTAGYNTVRFSNFMNTSPSAGSEFDASVYARIDYALDQARQLGIKIIFETTEISGIGTNRGYTFGDANWLALYQSFFNWLPARVNTVNGRTYKNDDTIAMYSICGEVGNNASLGTLYQTISGYIRANDNNHLICPGAMNPEQILDSSYGYQNFIEWDILNQSNIDVAATEGYYTFFDIERLYPNLKTYSQNRNKPWFVIEFGYDQNYNNEQHRATAFTKEFRDGLKSGCAGFIFWNFDNGQHGGYGVNPNTQETYNICRIFAKTTAYSPRLIVI